MTVSGSVRGIGLLVAATALTALIVPAIATATPAGSPPTSPVIRNCLSRAAVKPAAIDLACADANARIVGITWDSWSAEYASGVGTIRENTCTPDCARGTTTTRRVTVTAHTPVGRGGDRRFTVVTYGTKGNFRDADLPR